MDVIRVHAAKPYDVMIGTGLLSSAGQLISEVCAAKKAVTVSDDNVFALYAGRLEHSLKTSGFETLHFVFPHGEGSKSLSVYGQLLEFLCENNVSRGDVILALGGGVTGDLAGFAAATYRRGTNFVQLPTSLLAAVDSSVGGKTGVDLASGKNQAGCFYQPLRVLCDTDALKSLPEREYSNGCAEVIKYAVLKGEKLFAALENTPVSAQYAGIIARCVDIKREYVEKDEFDTGERMFLNFGHTFAHAVEKLSAYTVPHGQAVAMGMYAITRAAAKLGLCPEGIAERLKALLLNYNLPVKIPYSAEAMAKACLGDKKALGGCINLIVPCGIGKCEIARVNCEDIARWAKAGIG